jgi:hypothetical protein
MKTVYEENLFSKWIAVTLGVVALGLLLLLAYQSIVGPVGTRPAPNWVYLSLIVLFFSLAFNFSILKVRVTEKGLHVGYSLYHHTVPWSSIKSCQIDNTSALRYGGWGIRMARIDGKWRLVLNVPSTPIVVLSLNEGFFREFAFSTANPQELLVVIAQEINRRVPKHQ